MTIVKNSRFLKSIHHLAGFSALGFIWAGSLLFGLACSGQTFTTINLPALNTDAPHYGALNYTVTPAGDLLYGNSGHLYEQSSFGSSTITAFATSPDVDPSFIAAISPTQAVIGTGEFGASPLYTFNPANLATSAASFTAITTMQNYAGVAAGANGVYVAGTNGAGGVNAVSYVTLTGAQQLLIDQAGVNSAGIAADSAGNLYVADNDNNSVYEFTSAQLSNALSTHTPLNLLTNGTFVHTFSNGVGSIAVDGHGVLYSSGFATDGIASFNPLGGATSFFNPQTGDDVSGPGGDFPVYALQSFALGGTDYLSYVWQPGFTSGDSVEYGYAVVPEPAASSWLASILVLGCAFNSRRRSKQSRL